MGYHCTSTNTQLSNMQCHCAHSHIDRNSRGRRHLHAGRPDRCRPRGEGGGARARGRPPQSRQGAGGRALVDDERRHRQAAARNGGPEGESRSRVSRPLVIAALFYILRCISPMKETFVFSGNLKIPRMEKSFSLMLKYLTSSFPKASLSTICIFRWLS